MKKHPSPMALWTENQPRRRNLIPRGMLHSIPYLITAYLTVCFLQSVIAEISSQQETATLLE